MNFIEKVLPKGITIDMIPDIKHLDSFVGGTDYIDSIKPEDMEYNIMRGIDQYNRPYISCKNNENNDVQTFFKRYTEIENNVWTHGCFNKSFIWKYTGNIFNNLNAIDSIKIFIKNNL